VVEWGLKLALLAKHLDRSDDSWRLNMGKLEGKGNKKQIKYGQILR